MIDINGLKAQLGERCRTADDAALLNALISRYSRLACSVTHFDTLPDELCPYVETAVIRAYNKVGDEAYESQNVFDVSTKYVDIESDLIKQLSCKKNPASMVVI